MKRTLHCSTSLRWGLLALACMLLAPGCATTGMKMSPQTEAVLAAGDRALDTFNQKYARFSADMDALLPKISTLRQQPEWPLVEEVARKALAEEPPVELNQPDILAMRSVDPAVIPLIEPVFEDYLALVDRCLVLEARRVALTEELLSVESSYIAATVGELSKGRYKTGKTIYSVVEALSRIETDLSSRQLDAVGLYGSDTP